MSSKLTWWKRLPEEQKGWIVTNTGHQVVTSLPTLVSGSRHLQQRVLLTYSLDRFVC